MSAVDRGPRCRSCHRDEAKCAFEQGCCDRCTHFTWLDADGNSTATYHRPQRAATPIHRSVGDGWKRAAQLVTMRSARVAPAEGATSMAGATTGTSTKPAAQSWPFELFDNKPAHCPFCGRRTAWRLDGLRVRHRIEADNPLAPYCPTGVAA